MTNSSFFRAIRAFAVHHAAVSIQAIPGSGRPLQKQRETVADHSQLLQRLAIRTRIYASTMPLQPIVFALFPPTL
jgi:hypothetical protein